MDIALALAAAFFFALGLVLMEKAASAQPEEAVGGGFLVRLLRQPVWLLGLASQGVGFALQAAALGVGRMVVVQPVLVATIVFTLPIAKAVTKRRIRAIEGVGAGIVAAGLAVLLVATTTSEGTADATPGRWLIVGGACLGIAVALFLAGRFGSGSLRAGLIGTASGLLFGLAAALTKATVERLDEGVVAVVWDWHLYAMIAISISAFWLEQAALQTGALSAAVASTMAFDPLSSIPLGILLFDEQLHESAIGITISLIALAVTMAGLVLLARAKGPEPVEPGLLSAPVPAAGL